MSTRNDTEYHRQKLKEWKARHKAEGLCVYCKDKAVKGKRQCQKHLDYHKYYKKFRGKHNAKGIQATKKQGYENAKKEAVNEHG